MVEFRIWIVVDLFLKIAACQVELLIFCFLMLGLIFGLFVEKNFSSGDLACQMYGKKIAAGERVEVEKKKDGSKVFVGWGCLPVVVISNLVYHLCRHYHWSLDEWVATQKEALEEGSLPKMH